jgi:hypothetical protein
VRPPVSPQLLPLLCCAMSNGNRQDAPKKLAWFCRSCTMQDGQPARNLGHRMSCFRCHIAKGLCHLRNDQPPSPSRSLGGPRGGRSAHTPPRADQGSKADHALVAALQAKVKLLEAAVISGGPVGGTTTPVAAEAAPEFEEPIQQLLDQRAFYIKQGLPETCLKVVQVSAQIKLQRDTVAAAKPGHVRIIAAEKVIKQCKTAITTSAGQRTKLCDDLAGIQLAIANLDAQAVLLAQNLREAEELRSDLLLTLHGSLPDANSPAVGPVACMHLAQMSTSFEAVSDEAWGATGLSFDRKAMADFCRTLATFMAAARPSARARGSAESVDSSDHGPDLAVRMDTAVPGGLGFGLAAGTGIVAGGVAANAGTDTASGPGLESVLSVPAGPAAALTPAEARVPRPRDPLESDLSVGDMLAIWGASGVEQNPAQMQMAELVAENLAKRRCRPVSAGPLANA